jgi:ABC-2 type transport system permease protein
MRLLAEEQRSGTIELLLTSPVREIEVAFGKFLGAMGIVLFILALTLVYPLILMVYGNPDKGPILSGYIGILLWSGALVGIGLFTSSLTENQIIAAFLDFAILLTLWLVSIAIQQSNPGGAGTGNPLQDLLNSLSPFSHFDNFVRGQIDLRDVVYFLSLIAIGIFLTSRVLEIRRWR